jgi:predicted dehydrogenase
MKVLVVGTGSIGRRHLSNLMHLGVEVSAFSYRSAESESILLPWSVPLVKDLHKSLQADFDAVVVANRNDQHIAVALEAAKNNKGLFIEKPLSISLKNCSELLALAEEQNLIVETGFMLRLHPNLVWIKRYLTSGSLGKLMHMRASVGQWLPDWRPGTDYRTSYGAFRRTGGGVIFDLIHELDLVQWVAGTVVDVSAMIRHVECLEIETEAIAQICLRMTSGSLAQVHLDYVRPGYGRSLEIVGELGVLSWDYTAGTVSLTRADNSTEIMHRVPYGFERNSMFLAHMDHFLRRFSDPRLAPISSLEDGLHAMRVALACHRSAGERRCIRPEEIDHSYLPIERSI